MFRKLTGLLQRHKVKYQTIDHKKVYTVFDLSVVTGAALNEIAKTLLVKIDRRFVLAVLPGHRKLDLLKFKKIASDHYKKQASEHGEKFSAIKEIKIASEVQIKRNLTDGSAASLLPFGELYELDLFVDKLLLRGKKIIFSAGDFTRSVKITSNNYQKATQAITGTFTSAK